MPGMYRYQVGFSKPITPLCLSHSQPEDLSRHPDGRCTVVPVHSGETIGPGLFNKILRDCDIEVIDMLVLLKKK